MCFIFRRAPNAAASYKCECRCDYRLCLSVCCTLCLTVLLCADKCPEANGSLICCFSFFLFLKKSRPFLPPRKDVFSRRSKDAWGHLFYLIITLPALLHRAALSLLRHLKCLAGLFSETITKLCANTPPTAPPPSILQPCVQEPERRFLHRCSANRKTNRGSSIRTHLHPTEFIIFIKSSATCWFKHDRLKSTSHICKQTFNLKSLVRFCRKKKKFVPTKHVFVFICSKIQCTEQTGAVPTNSWHWNFGDKYSLTSANVYEMRVAVVYRDLHSPIPWTTSRSFEVWKWTILCYNVVNIPPKKKWNFASTSDYCFY